jgi:hypothetical protein
MFGFVMRLAGRTRDFLNRPVQEALQATPTGPDAASQILLWLQYQDMVRTGRQLPALSEVGFQAYSQTDEDGIIWFLLAVIGNPLRTCVEVCAGDGRECNSANLILNHRWHGLLVDGDSAKVERGRQFYSTSRATAVYPPRYAQAWVTRNTINNLIASHGFTGEVDLLTIDVDGVDYWLWEALEVITPRIVVVEFNDILGPDRAWTVPYADDFRADRYPMTDGMPNFAGASLSAFVKLARRKGYRLVGANRYGFNAFFVRNGFADSLLPQVSTATCLTHPKVRDLAEKRFATVAGLPWVEV